MGILTVTKRGIYHNLKESKYTVSNTEIVFYFSSVKYLEKFLSCYEAERDRYNERMLKLNKEMMFNYESLSDLNLYRKIETRGCRITIEGIDVTWQDTQKFALRKMINENTQNWSKIPAPKLAERLKIMGRI